MLEQVLLSRAAGKINDPLARMFILLVERFFSRANYRFYTYCDEMKSEALMQLSYAALKFDPEKSSNPFSFYTTVIANAGNRILNREKKVRLIRDEILVEHNLLPSLAAQNYDLDIIFPALPRIAPKRGRPPVKGPGRPKGLTKRTPKPKL
jgi:hypothetical protein